MDTFALAALTCFILLQLGVAFWAGRRIGTEADYLLGGRSLGVVLAGFSLFATWFGAETVVASSGAIAAEGLSGARAEPFGYAICLLLFAFFIAYRMRAANFMTTSDYYLQRFGPAAEKLSALLVVPTSLIWSAAQIVAFAHILAALTGLDYGAALFYGMLLVVLYTTVGGYMGDVITDCIMAVVIVFGLSLTAWMITQYIGGPEVALARITPEKLSIVAPGVPLLAQLDEWTIAIVGSLVSQEAISRFLGTRSPDVARRACFFAAGLYLLVGLIPVYIGLIGGGVVGAPDAQEGDAFLPTLVQTVLPKFGYVIFLGALVSAILSTVNTTLLSVGALIGHNIVAPLMQEGFKTDRSRIWLERGLVVLAGFMTYSIAVSGDSIYELIELSSTFGSAGLVACLLIGLWTGIGGSIAALTTMIAGVLSSWMYQYALEWQAGYIASLATCAIVYLAVAFFEKNRTSPAHA